MTEPLTLLVKKDESKRLRWVQKAQSKDDARPILCGVHVNNNDVIATDGYRIHATQAPSDMMKFNGKILQGKVPSGDNFVVMQEITGKFPDTSSFSNDDDPIISICLNSKYLADAVSGMDGMIRLVLWSENQPVEMFGKTKDAVPCHVVLMPMHGGEATQPQWKPVSAQSDN